ncbi:MAG: Nif3-like dinuclear metal center hexameric protein [Bacteroidota bacterium]
MAQIHDITTYLETIAPRSYQESYDNAGLLTGNPQAKVSGVLVSLDAIESVVDEAVKQNCNLIVAHHPIIFRGLKSLTGRTYIERTIIKAIKNDIAIYAIHTNLDNVYNGVNAKIAEKLGLQQTRVLVPKSQTLQKITTFVPRENAEAVLNALSQAGAGNIGNYQNCSFQVSGTGTFQPNKQANPHIGEAGKLERVDEQRIEVILPNHLTNRVLQALRTAHPYEEVAYYLHDLENENQEVGSGMIGLLPQAQPGAEFLGYLKEKMNLSIIRHTALLGRPVKTVAVCGGSGSFLLPHAIRQQADAYVTADYKYHEFFDADGQIMIADIGHYESEVHTKELIQELLCQKFVSFAVHLAETNTNPVFYT